jgi:AcrR family transcriptional regulator
MKQFEQMTRRKTGRPLSFDREAALHQAMLLFWRHGYETTSLSDLTAAMGVTPPSIYTAFGDKKRLFLEAVGLYLSGEVTSERIIDEAATAREAALGLLQAAAIGFTGVNTPSGCLLASSAISCSTAAADVQGELATIRHGIEARLKDKIVQAIKAGEMIAETDADAIAGHVMAVIQGMSTLARDGASREKLMRVVATAMLAWSNSESQTDT